ncbi:MAG: DNA polymerase III subunit beta [Armatimonadetes bacterium]|nr:DNA polymerase III subunit beta [Armatimonadota bacterium]
MKLECSRKDLLDALVLAGSASSVRTAMPILQTLRITAGESSLTLLGCDSEMWAERRVLATVHDPGSICVSSSLMRDLVSKLPEGKVSLEEENGQLFIRTAMSEWRMLALPAEDFPEIPEVPAVSELRLNMGEFRKSVDSVLFAVADDNSRPVLTGVMIKYDSNLMTLVATDTHRLAVLKLRKEGIGSDITAVVPEKALKAIKALPLDDEAEITITFDETRIAVNSGDGRVVSQLLMGQYPSWERVVPAETTRTWTLDRTELIDNVNRAMILAKDNAYRIKFSGHGDQVLISARSEDKGEAKEEVAAVAKNGDIEIAFNGKYVLEALNALNCDAVKAEMTEASRPAIFRPTEDDESHFCVIMPMALG